MPCGMGFPAGKKPISQLSPFSFLTLTPATKLATANCLWCPCPSGSHRPMKPPESPERKSPANGELWSGFTQTTCRWASTSGGDTTTAA